MAVKKKELIAVKTYERYAWKPTVVGGGGYSARSANRGGGRVFRRQKRKGFFTEDKLIQLCVREGWPVLKEGDVVSND